MQCPNCSAKLATLNYDNQEVLHCPQCSGSFFELNGINRVSLKSARILALEQIEGEVPKVNATKLCPKDESPLYLITSNPAIPQHVSLFECESCKGVFAMPQDLINFKRAQTIKIDFFKLWNRPMPSVKAVLVLSSFIFIFASILATQLPRTQTTSTQASDVIKNIFITGTEDQLYIYFSTQEMFTSRLILTNTLTGNTHIQIISDALTTAHSTTINNIDLTARYTYHIILTDRNGKEVRTEEQKIEIK